MRVYEKINFNQSFNFDIRFMNLCINKFQKIMSIALLNNKKNN